MDVLITGGAGFIGSHLTRALVDSGHRVIVLDNLHLQVHARPPAHLPDGVELVIADVRDRPALQRVVQRADAIYHLAALTGVGQSMYQIAEYTDVNVGGTAVLLDILANEPHHVQRFILASSRAVYGEGAYECKACGPVPVSSRDCALLERGQWDPLCPNCGSSLQCKPTSEDCVPSPASVYAASKLTQEYLIRAVGDAYGLEIVILRYFNVYGPGQSLTNPYTGVLSIFFSQLQGGKKIEVYEDGLESRDFVYVMDVVRASLLALECPQVAGEVLNVGSGKAMSVLEVAQSIAKLVGQPDQFYISGRFRVGDIRHCRADIDKARGLLGFTPQWSLERGLETFINWTCMQTVGGVSVAEAEGELRRRNLLRDLISEPQR
jgi:dTDP-L-rhamnose 4-epimerase